MRELTTTKPDYKIQYLMDNCEVYEGLRLRKSFIKAFLRIKRSL
ncbi:MAG: hypothetical protein ACLR56_03485 [Oscillospiraceae bacterium]